MLKGRLEGHLCRFGTGDRPRPDAGLPGTTACASWPWVAGCVAGVKPVSVRSASESSNCVRASPCCEGVRRRWDRRVRSTVLLDQPCWPCSVRDRLHSCRPRLLNLAVVGCRRSGCSHHGGE